MKTLIRGVLLACLIFVLSSKATNAQNSSIVTRCKSDVQSDGANGLNLSTALSLGGSIIFDCGEKATIRITRTHQISKDVELKGARKITFDLQDSVRAFDLVNPEATLTLRGINVQGSPKTVIPSNDQSVAAGFIRNSVGASINLYSGVIEGNANSIYTVGGRVRIKDMTFLSNQTAIVNRGGVVEIADNTVFSNRGVTGRGLVVISNDGAMKIESSYFTELNPLVAVISNRGSLSIEDSEFVKNKKGVILSSGEDTSSLTIKTSQFRENVSDRAGGAINSASKMQIDDSLFLENFAVECGGAIFVIQVPPLPTNIRNSRFEGNRAKCGGAIEIETEISSEIELITIANTTFIQNSATDIGGALGISIREEDSQINGVIALRNVIFSQNDAQFGGGAIGAENAGLQIDRTVFVENHAGEGGAAIYLVSIDQAPSSFLANSLVVRNSATETGGTVTLQNQAPFYVVNSTIMDNRTEGGKGEDTITLSGSALIGLEPGKLHLANTIIANNIGGNCEGGGVVDDGHNLQFPDDDCSATIPVFHPLLDARYMPTALSPTRGRGDDSLCSAPPVNGIDLFGEKRSIVLDCTIGAIERQMTPPIKEQ